MKNSIDINTTFTSSTLLFMDKNFSQFFTQTGQEKNFVDTCQQTNLTCCITGPKLREEYENDGVQVNKYLDTGTWKFLKVPFQLGTFSKGEDEVIAVLNNEDKIKENAWFGTYDKEAVNKCRKSRIKNLNHLDFLILMIQVGKISWEKAELIYKSYPSYRKENSPTLRDYYRKYYRRINYKLINLINKKYGKKFTNKN